MPNIECPTCGTTTFLASFDEEAEAFCRVCDFPLFWAEEGAGTVAADRLELQRQRLPGVAGRRTLGGIACPACEEINPYDGIACYRCGAELHPVPEEEPIAIEQEPLLEPLEPLLLKPAGRTINAALAAAGIGLLMTVVAIVAAAWQAIGAAGPLFAVSQATLDAAPAGSSVLAQLGSHHAIPAWLGVFGVLAAGIVLAGFILMLRSLIPHVGLESRTAQQALPRLTQRPERKRP